MKKRYVSSLIFLSLFSFAIFGQSFCIIKPGTGLNNIIIGVSTIDSVINEFGHNKINKTWHDGVEADLIGRYDYHTHYKNLGVTFSTYSLNNRNPDQIIKTITIDSTSSCKTTDGIGIGSTLKEVRAALPGNNESYFLNKNLGLSFDNMNVIFKGKDTATAKVFQIIIQNDFVGKTINGKTYNFILNYDSSTKVHIAGNYIPGTLIKNGEWLFFYKNGQIAARSYFVKDFKKGTWTTYDEHGKITHTEEKNDSMTSDYEPNDFGLEKDRTDHFAVYIVKIIEIILCFGRHCK